MPDTQEVAILTPLVAHEHELSDNRALVLIQGYMTENDQTDIENDKWLSGIRAAGWEAPVMQLNWDSGHLGQLVRNLGAVALLRLGAKLVARRVAFPLPPIGLYELAQLHGHWSRASRSADKMDVDAILESIRETHPSGSVTLMGHSLGAKVVVKLAEASHRHDYSFHDAILVGGALSRRDERLAHAAENLEGSLLNVYHGGDRVLKWLYKAGEITRFSPCGLKPVLIEHTKIANADATNLLKPSFRSHVAYASILKDLVAGRLW